MVKYVLTFMAPNWYLFGDNDTIIASFKTGIELAEYLRDNNLGDKVGLDNLRADLQEIAKGKKTEKTIHIKTILDSLTKKMIEEIYYRVTEKMRQTKNDSKRNELASFLQYIEKHNYLR